LAELKNKTKKSGAIFEVNKKINKREKKKARHYYKEKRKKQHKTSTKSLEKADK